MRWLQSGLGVERALFFLSVSILLGSLMSCDLSPKYETIEAPQEIREKAFTIAQFYIGMDYEWGGQTHWTSKGVDCSGLIVNVYAEAVAGTPYSMPYEDAAVVNLINKYTREVYQPKRGDLVFMGDEEITHVALLDKIENGYVYFIDAYSLSGAVEHRKYETGNYKIKHYGRHLLWH